MSALSRTAVVAEMQGRDLLRRRAVMTLLVLLPAAFYYSVPADQDYGLLAGSIGVSWAVAAAGVFGILGWRRADPRLALAGAPAHQALLGRLLLLLGLGLGLVALFAPQILWRSAALIDEPATLVGALALMAIVSVPLGLAIGSLVPRELEGTLVLIGIVGVSMSVPPDTAVARSLPLWGPIEILQISAGLSDGPAAPGAVHALASALILLCIASWSWRRRVRVHT
ncbi:MAG TPA: hypothetical protein VML96_04130 [Egibacteraceae bacterium]|nr:hypothetical protein [Egibacteraceae bacterium]